MYTHRRRKRGDLFVNRVRTANSNNDFIEKTLFQE